MTGSMLHPKIPATKRCQLIAYDFSRIAKQETSGTARGPGIHHQRKPVLDARTCRKNTRRMSPQETYKRSRFLNAGIGMRTFACSTGAVFSSQLHEKKNAEDPLSQPRIARLLVCIFCFCHQCLKISNSFVIA